MRDIFHKPFFFSKSDIIRYDVIHKENQMARVTVEDCTKNIPNRFELVLVSAARSKKLSNGLAPTVKRDNDKNPVLALREIASDQVLAEELRDNLLASMQKVRYESQAAEDEEQELDLEKDWSEQIAQLSRELESLGSIEDDLLENMQVDGEDVVIEDDENIDLDVLSPDEDDE
jgi:DNA-directed RNA polymerase subunit omega